MRHGLCTLTAYCVGNVIQREAGWSEDTELQVSLVSPSIDVALDKSP